MPTPQSDIDGENDRRLIDLLSRLINGLIDAPTTHGKAMRLKALMRAEFAADRTLFLLFVQLLERTPPLTLPPKHGHDDLRGGLTAAIGASNAESRPT